MSYNPKREYDTDEDILVAETEKHHIVIHNDDFNTFDFVINCLMNICEHSQEQAEQCTFLIHFKGRCEVKAGSIADLLPRHKKLLQSGLTSEII
ncbi:MAG: ATP-dependent Clp protease adaptor ClpS [Flavobacteriales bacterium]|nr:ATP-dependent Clp protease adaptor ClpS [Flavobacteriales bacterium]